MKRMKHEGSTLIKGWFVGGVSGHERAGRGFVITLQRISRGGPFEGSREDNLSRVVAASNSRLEIEALCVQSILRI